MKLEVIRATSVNEISLGAYQKFQEVCATSNDEEFISMKMIEIFCGIDLKDVVKIKLSSVAEMITHFSKLFSTKNEFTHRFKIGTQEFGFIPSIEDISMGEYIDIVKYSSSWEDMHKAMAAMYRPIIKTKGNAYEIQEYSGTVNYADVMKFAPCGIAIAASVFFWTLGNELIKAIPHFLEKKMSKQMRTTLASQLNLANDGDGINQFMQSLKETWSDSMQLQPFHYTSV
jgi:hypothetical protein